MPLIPERPFPAAIRSLADVGLDREAPPLRRRTEGGIDYDWYLLRAHGLRSSAYRFGLARIAAAIGATVTGWFAAWREWRRHQRAVAELLALDDRSLRDLGLGRSSVDFAVDHGREDVVPANTNLPPEKKPSQAA